MNILTNGRGIGMERSALAFPGGASYVISCLITISGSSRCSEVPCFFSESALVSFHLLRKSAICLLCKTSSGWGKTAQEGYNQVQRGGDAQQAVQRQSFREEVSSFQGCRIIAPCGTVFNVHHMLTLDSNQLITDDLWVVSWCSHFQSSANFAE